MGVWECGSVGVWECGSNGGPILGLSFYSVTLILRHPHTDVIVRKFVNALSSFFVLSPSYFVRPGARVCLVLNRPLGDCNG